MNARLLIVCGFSILLISGCQQKSNNTPDASKSTEELNASSTEDSATKPEDGMEKELTTADALAHKTEQYSREVELLVQQRMKEMAQKQQQQQQTQSARAATPYAGTALPQNPSAVTWLDPEQFKLWPSHGQDEHASGQAEVIPVAEANRPVMVSQASAGEGAVASAAPTPAPAIRRTDAAAAPESLDSLKQQFRQRLASGPQDLDAHLDYQLLLFLRGESVPDLPSAGSLPAEDREILAAVLDGLTNFRAGVQADRNMLLSKKVQPLLAMGDRLRSQAELTISTISLASKVRGFGDYDPIAPLQFVAGKAHEVVIYCEVANFSSQLTASGKWESQLQHEAVLYSADKEFAVWHDKTSTVTDKSSSRRHDFFTARIAWLPESLTIGRYILKVTIVDQQANRISEATLPIVVVGQ